ncbi:hypothetical protein [Kocuria rosea]|uniref:hypothetical protein n=1 Tax=Kocuria rosea TaxID=1275 RepID=UPI002B24C3CD|nr:hypothetical protein [Kocuria rosea]MEB2529069.1 hypothetical protein [Kocuria rosea]MEB2619256.1 hypothetical protein [Kocuria rosea]
MTKQTRQKMTGAQSASAGLSVAGAIIYAPAAAFFGTALGDYPTRMQCTAEVQGSGCYEGELLIGSMALALFYLPFFALSLGVAVMSRHRGRPVMNWWPFALVCGLGAFMILGMAAGTYFDPNADL